MMPIRILHCFGRMDQGGAETFVMNVYRNINREQIQFDFVVHTNKECAYDPEIKALGGRIYSVPRYTVANHLAYKKAWERLLTSNAGVWQAVHGHLVSTATIYFKVARKRGLITIAHSHSTSSGCGLGARMKDIMQVNVKNNADYLFACSQPAGQWLYGKKTDDKQRYKIIRNAIDATRFVFDQDERNRMRAELGVEGKFVIGHVGSMSKPKNHGFLLDVAKAVYEHKKEIALVLVGDGALRSNIERKVKALGLDRVVVFTGVRQDIPELLNAMDVFVFPSLYEGLPMALIEAQANGLRCIVSDRVPSEAKITDLVEFISLEKPAEFWANRLLQWADGYPRLNRYSEISMAGYNIKESTDYLERFYLDMCTTVGRSQGI